MEISSDVLVNVLMNKVNALTSENLVKESMIQQLQNKLATFEVDESQNDLKVAE